MLGRDTRRAYVNGRSTVFDLLFAGSQLRSVVHHRLQLGARINRGVDVDEIVSLERRAWLRGDTS